MIWLIGMTAEERQNGPDLRGTKLKLWGLRGSRGYSIYVCEEFVSLWTIIVTNAAFRSKGAKKEAISALQKLQGTALT